MDDLKQFIKIRDEGDAHRKWLRVAESQLLAQCMICPCCDSDNAQDLTVGIDKFYRCPDCYCTWEVDIEGIRAKAKELVDKMEKEELL